MSKRFYGSTFTLATSHFTRERKSVSLFAIEFKKRIKYKIYEVCEIKEKLIDVLCK